jgi:hypothetical protein
MADDVIFPKDSDDLGRTEFGPPGSRSEIEGVKYITMEFIPAGHEKILPDGTKLRLMRVLIMECLTKLYFLSKARDN